MGNSYTVTVLVPILVIAMVDKQTVLCIVLVVDTVSEIVIELVQVVYIVIDVVNTNL